MTADRDGDRAETAATTHVRSVTAASREEPS
jgi:hypothetical protein